MTKNAKIRAVEEKAVKVGTRNANRATLPKKRPPHPPQGNKSQNHRHFQKQNILNNFVDDLRLQVCHCITLHAFR